MPSQAWCGARAPGGIAYFARRQHLVLVVVGVPPTGYYFSAYVEQPKPANVVTQCPGFQPLLNQKGIGFEGPTRRPRQGPFGHGINFCTHPLLPPGRLHLVGRADHGLVLSSSLKPSISPRGTTTVSGTGTPFPISLRYSIPLWAASLVRYGSSMTYPPWHLTSRARITKVSSSRIWLAVRSSTILAATSPASSFFQNSFTRLPLHKQKVRLF